MAGGGKGGGSAPTPIDPMKIIQAEEQANRINKITPFGSQVYGPNGLETKLDPTMQGLVNKQEKLAGTDLTPLKTPDSFGQLQNSLMARMQGPDSGAKGAMQQLPQLQQMSSGFAGNPGNPFSTTDQNPILKQIMTRMARMN